VITEARRAAGGLAAAGWSVEVPSAAMREITVGLKLTLSRAIHVSAVAENPSGARTGREPGDQIAQISVGALTPGGSGLQAPALVAIRPSIRIRRFIDGSYCRFALAPIPQTKQNPA